MAEQYHVPVLVHALLNYLPDDKTGIFVDGTLGGGGHAEAVLRQLDIGGRLIVFDMDTDAITAARKKLDAYESRVTYIDDNVAHLRTRLRDLGISAIRMLLLDLGVSSHQLDESARGFSFQMNGRLDMRMDLRASLDARTVLNTYEEQRLAALLREYGDVRAARAISRRIGARRSNHALETTADLAEIVMSVTGHREGPKALARVFQAVRIEVNQELENLRRVLHDAVDLLAKDGRIIVISYHSLEDRIVKNFFRDASVYSVPAPSRLEPPLKREPKLRILTKKPIVPQPAELALNPRARSAKLRVAERL